MEKLFEQLKEYTAMDEKEARACFAFGENEKDIELEVPVYVVKVVNWIDRATFKAMQRLKEDKGGRYSPSPDRTFFIPKQKRAIDSQATYKDAGNALPSEPSENKSEELDEETVELLRHSSEQQGELLPVVKDQHGTILSGRHRKAANPNWRETVIETTGDLDRLLKIIHFNIQRRPSREETTRRLLQIAEILEGRGVENADICSEISKITPYSEQWVRELLPDKYKHREFASEPKVVSPPIKTQDTTLETPSFQSIQEKVMGQIIECEQCGQHVHRSKAVIVKGLLVCQKCAGKDKVVKVKAPSQPTKTKVTEPWTERLARMQTEVSQMDRYILEKAMQDQDLRDRGYKVEFQKIYLLTKSDITIEKPGEEYPVFVDNLKIHQKRQVRDETITAVLNWQEAIQKGGVIRVPYEGSFSKAKGEEVYRQIKEALA